MRFFVVYTFFFIILLPPQARAQRTDSLLRELDKTILDKDYYVGIKQEKIELLKRKTGEPGNSRSELFDLNARLIAEYQSFRFDSAMLYAGNNMELAGNTKDPKRYAQSQIGLSYILLGGGLYMESIENLRTIDRARLSAEDLADYYACWEQTYLHLSKYAEGSVYSARYDSLARVYVDSLRLVVPENSENIIALSRIYVRDEDPYRSKRKLTELLERIPFGTREYAVVAANLYQICYDDVPERENYLILSAMSDIMNAVKENESLRELANVMYERGDIERAYRYCTLSMEDANFYNARLRRIEIAKTQPIIERAYTLQIEAQHRRLKQYIVLVSILALLVLTALLVILRQMIQLRKARVALTHSNYRLGRVNESLVEANRVKEEYVGHFLSLCSSYINKLARYQSMVHNRITGGKINELKAMAGSTEIIDREIAEFYKNFDKAFLRIYPDFVDQFNALLRPEERIVPKLDELLNTELRIFALIRLGINDSASIAKFLRYSANTVYTYRTKIRNKSLHKSTFEDDILRIGL